MSKPLVSIIIPTYNSRHFIEDTVDSALKQTYEVLEIIVIDDGSTDGTADLFPEFKKNGIDCYSIENGGASNARNYGLSKANGDYIQFLDADDIIDSTKIEKQIEIILKRNADLCYTPWVNFKDSISDSAPEFRFKHIDHSKNKTGKELMISYGMENWFIPTVSWLVSKVLIKKAGFWNPAKCPNDDGEYFSRILFWAKNVVCCNSILAYYRSVPSDSLSKLNSELKINAAFKSYQQIEALLNTCNDSNLMSYPKRAYYTQFKLINEGFPKLARRAANKFDAIEGPSYLDKKQTYSKFIRRFGLYNGTRLYLFLRPVWAVLKGNGSIKKVSE